MPQIILSRVIRRLDTVRVTGSHGENYHVSLLVTVRRAREIMIEIVGIKLYSDV